MGWEKLKVGKDVNLILPYTIKDLRIRQNEGIRPYPQPDIIILIHSIHMHKCMQYSGKQTAVTQSPQAGGCILKKRKVIIHRMVSWTSSRRQMGEAPRCDVTVMRNEVGLIKVVYPAAQACNPNNISRLVNHSADHVLAFLQDPTEG